MAVGLLVILGSAPRVLGSSGMAYYGGPTMHQTTTYAIYWLPSGDHFEGLLGIQGLLGSDASYESLTSRFLNDIGGSTYLNIVSQYYDHQNGSILPESPFGGSYIDTNSYPSSTPTGQDIANQVLQAMSAMGWTGGLTHAFVIFTAAGVSPTGATTEYCAYHDFTTSGSGQPVVYAYIPDLYSFTGTLNCGVIAHLISPNSDPWADMAINLISHELFESITDPMLNAWGTDESEIGDLCAWQFGPSINNIGADVQLNGNYYLVQEEWSNYNGACIMSLSPVGAYTISLGLLPSAGATSGPFNLTYQSLGATRWTTISGISYYNLYLDSNSQLTVSSIPVQGGLEKRCLSSTCASASFSLGSCPSNSLCLANVGSFYYYDLLSQTIEVYLRGGGDVSIPLTYLTAPANPGTTDSQTVAITQLSTTPQTIWVERGTTMSVPPSTGSPTERWVTTTSTLVITSGFIPLQIVFNHQYLVTFSFAISGGGVGYVSPVVGYYAEGNYTSAATGGPLWADATQPYIYPKILGGSTSSEQWSLGALTNVVTSAGTISATYFHQYAVSISYSITGGGNPQPPSITATSLGQTASGPLPNPQVSGFLDAGSSYIISNTLTGSTSNERWYSSSTRNAGMLDGPMSISLAYYHQFAITASYSTSGGGNQTPPAFSGTANGTPFIVPLTLQTTPIWVDVGSAFRVPNQLASNSTERWITNQTATGTANSAQTTTWTYQHQYYVQVAVLPSTAGAVNQSSGWFDAGSSLHVTTIPNAGLSFVSWTSSSSSLAFNDSKSPSTDVTIGAPGTITANFAIGSITSSTTSSSTSSTRSTISTLGSLGTTSQGARTSIVGQMTSQNPIFTALVYAVLAVIVIGGAAVVIGMSRRR